MRSAKARWTLIVSLIAVLWCDEGRTASCLRVWGEGFDPASVPDVESAIAIAAGPEHGIVLRSDRTIARWGGKTTYVGSDKIPATATNVAAIAAGMEHCVAARLDGSVVCWGRNIPARTPPPGLSDVVAVAAGDKFSAGLKRDGTLITWGLFSDGSAPPSGLTGINAVSAAVDHFIVLHTDATVMLYGNIDPSFVEFAQTLTNIKAVSAGPRCFMALKADGSIVSWGPQPPSGTPSTKNFQAISAGGLTHGLALSATGVTAWGNINGNTATVPAELTGTSLVLAIAAGHTFSAAILQTCSAPVPADVSVSPDTTVCAGTLVTLSQSATGGTEPFTYQWLKNGSPIQGATDSTTQLVPLNSQEQYACRVSSACGLMATSGPVSFGVRPAPTAVDRVYYRSGGTSYKIPVGDFGTSGTLHSVGASGEGATISFDSDFIYYVPGLGNNNSDSFTYTLSDGYCLGSGTISMVVNEEARSVEIDHQNGVISILFHGIPDVEYRVERCEDASFGPGMTSTVLVTNAPQDGAFRYSEAATGSAFFRVVN